MSSIRTRTILATVLAVTGTICMGMAASFAFAVAFPFYVSVTLFVAGLGLVAVAVKIAPPDFRRPRGGPMIDPDKTIVVRPEDK